MSTHQATGDHMAEETPPTDCISKLNTLDRKLFEGAESDGLAGRIYNPPTNKKNGEGLLYGAGYELGHMKRVEQAIARDRKNRA